LVEQARAAKSELLLLLGNAGLQNWGFFRSLGDDEHLRGKTPFKAAENLTFAEDAQMSAFDEHLRQKNEHLRDSMSTFAEPMSTFDEKPAKALIEDAHLSIFAEPQHSCGFQVPDAAKALISPERREESSFSRSKTGRFELQPSVIRPASFAPAVAPTEWLDGLSRLRANWPPGDVPMRRWQQFITDARRLLRDGTLAQTAALGWTGLDLFGCDDTKPFARIDQMGLVWLVSGWRVLSLSPSAAVIKAPTGSQQTYRRKLAGSGQVLAWNLSSQSSKRFGARLNPQGSP
jgi:hypothetical protein